MYGTVKPPREAFLISIAEGIKPQRLQDLYKVTKQVNNEKLDFKLP